MRVVAGRAFFAVLAIQGESCRNPRDMDLISHELNSLTEREREVLRLLANGHDIKSIARELSISPSAVTDRLRQARRKLGLSTSREAARLFADSDLSPRNGVHTFTGEANSPDPRQQRLSKGFARGGIAMVILIAAAASFFSLIDARRPAPVHERLQLLPASNVAAHKASRSVPAETSFAINPRELCEGGPPAGPRRGLGFTLQCAVHRREPHAIPIDEDRYSNARPEGASGPPPSQRNVRPRAVPLVAQRIPHVH
jgi:DNA-binding CsgD family transcriptional regulator